MGLNIYILIIAASVWMVIEGLLLLRDKVRAKGMTKIDRLTRLFNGISVCIAACSPWLIPALPALRLAETEWPVLTWAGTAVIAFGFFVRYWSIIVLGKNFRTTVEIDRGQKIVQAGPYRFLRHPSYSGTLLFFAGYGLVSQHWLSLAICLVLPAAALLYRIKVEEEALVKEMGAEYKNYQSKTKKLIPGIW